MTYEDITELKENHNTKFALKNINLKIKTGEKIAFVGRTGSGKTSILNVIFKLYDFQYG
jgi:ABC-type multidrug transport system fused ATPase/permease subunit